MTRRRWRVGRPRSIRFERGVPRPVLWQRWELPVKWGTRVLIWLSVLSALLGLAPLPGFALALVLLGAQLLLERTIFRVPALHITPLPDFKYESAKWHSMAYLFDDHPLTGPPSALGLVFTDEDYAKKFFELLLAWAYGNSEDRAGDLSMSFVVDESEYFVFLHPHPNRPAIRKSRDSLKRKVAKQGAKYEPQLMVLGMTICKSFETDQGYWLGEFSRRYKQGQPYDLRAFVIDRDGKIEPVSGAPAIRRFELRVVARADLKEDEFEYVHLKSFGA